MPRPCCLRHIGFKPPAGLFGPVGVSACALEPVTLTLDEVEALRLADLNGLYQEQAAAQMKVSRPTFARIVEQARRKVAEALIHGRMLRLEGGTVRMAGEPDGPPGDGTGPVAAGQGGEAGPCDCRERHGRAAAGGAGFQPCCGRPAPAPPARTKKMPDNNQVEKGRQSV